MSHISILSGGAAQGLHGGVEGCKEEPDAVVGVATVDECSEKLDGGLGRHSLKGKLVVKARRVPERLGHDNHQDCVALPCAT